jgi:phage shock protein PspC (stress-responsive transcriptional regulator)
MAVQKEKKLFRSESDKMIAGICGGLAVYLGLDPTVVRVLWVVLSLFNGVGIILYFILWFVIPTESEVAK